MEKRPKSTPASATGGIDAGAAEAQKVKIGFGGFTLDLAAGALYKGIQHVALKPKAYALLAYLVSHAGRLVGKEELLGTVWPRGFVCDAVLKVCIREIRQALGEDPEHPRFLHTVHRRGYRFVLDHTPLQAARSATRLKRDSDNSELRQRPLPAEGPVNSAPIGRRQELAALASLAQQALHGEPRLVFVCGEAGIGKTTLIKAFSHSLAASGFKVLHYRCRPRITQSALNEPLLSIVRDAYDWSESANYNLLTRHAPSWVGALAPESRHGSHGKADRAEHLVLTEGLALLTALSVIEPLVLALDDLQWATPCLLDTILEFAHLTSGAHLVFSGTMQVCTKPQNGQTATRLRRALEIQGRCTTLQLAPLTKDHAIEFAAQAAGSTADAETLGHLLHKLSDGHPGFMMAAWRYWIESAGLSSTELVERDNNDEIWAFLPTIRHYLESQMELLNAQERMVIEAASVCTEDEFSATSVATMLSDDIIMIETLCERLAESHAFLRRVKGSHQPERRSASRYQFVNKVCKRMIEQSLPRARLNLYKAKLST